jgi:hypothetical protein
MIISDTSKFHKQSVNEWLDRLYICLNSISTWFIFQEKRTYKPIYYHDNQTYVTNLLFFFSSSSDMRQPYVLHFTYLYTSLPVGEHELPNTCTTCVCLMVKISFPSIYLMFNMQNMHVHDMFVLLFKSVVRCSISLASH